MRRYLVCLFFVAVVGCGDVTSTGNPCQPGECAGEAPTSAEPGNVYTNNDFGVQVAYPSGWTAEESSVADAADGGGVGASAPVPDVIFTSGEAGEVTQAVMSFERVASEPTSLESYLRERFPDRMLTREDRTLVSGFLFDDLSEGTDGSDRRTYYFLNRTTLVTIVANVFPSGETAFGEFLNGISFF